MYDWCRLFSVANSNKSLAPGTLHTTQTQTMLYFHSCLMWVIPQLLLMTKGLEGFQRALVTTTATRNGLSALALAEQVNNVMNSKLEPEPEGGKELSPLKTLPNCRMKEISGSTAAGLPADGFQFWMTAEADGKLVKEIRTQVLKEAAKKANFPGFRKVRVTRALTDD
jgi:hypothetical protein